MAITVFQSIAYYQLFNVNPIWIQQPRRPDDSVGLHVPIPWYQASNSLFAILGVPLVFGIWRWQARRGGEPGDLGKIGLGALDQRGEQSAAGGGDLPGGHRSGPPDLARALLVAPGDLVPLLLAHAARAGLASGPGQGSNATLMGLTFMSLFVANTLIGWIGGFYERMSPAAFWTLHGAIGAVGGLLVMLFGRRLGRALKA